MAINLGKSKEETKTRTTLKPKTNVSAGHQKASRDAADGSLIWSVVLFSEEPGSDFDYPEIKCARYKSCAAPKSVTFARHSRLHVFLLFALLMLTTVSQSRFAPGAAVPFHGEWS